MWIEDGVPSHSMQFYCRSDSRKNEPESLRTEEEEEEERADRVECHRQKVEVISISSVIAIYNIKISLSLSLFSSHLCTICGVLQFAPCIYNGTVAVIR